MGMTIEEGEAALVREKGHRRIDTAEVFGPRFLFDVTEGTNCKGLLKTPLARWLLSGQTTRESIF